MFARYSSIAAGGSGGGGSKWNVDGGDGECSRNWWSGRDEEGQRGGFYGRKSRDGRGHSGEFQTFSIEKEHPEHSGHVFVARIISNINL
jgi:hypothetical protein